MASIRVVLDPEAEGFGLEYTGELIHLSTDAEIVVSGLPDGMAAGEDGKKRPSMAFAFTLPNGDLVIVETSWRLFSGAHAAFLAKFGEPEVEGMRVELDDGRTLQLVGSEKPFVKCGHCRWRLDGANSKESVEHLMTEYERHYRKKHRGIPAPPPFPGLN